jgi:uncharacterized membrane protein YhaH (DUF805 family)
MNCPKCNLIKAAGTELCDCGYEFPNEQKAGPDAHAEPLTTEHRGQLYRSIWSFQGRERRVGFWAANILLLAFNLPIGIMFANLTRGGYEGLATVILIACTFVTGWIGLALQVRRWHDLNKSGWMVLLNFTLIFIPISWIILGCVPGTKALNRYDSDPFRPRLRESPHAPRTTCDRCRESFPSHFYLEKSAEGQYLCEKCRATAQSAGTT